MLWCMKLVGKVIVKDVVRTLKVGGNINIGCREAKFEHLDSIYLNQDGSQQCVLKIIVKNLWVS